MYLLNDTDMLQLPTNTCSLQCQGLYVSGSKFDYLTLVCIWFGATKPCWNHHKSKYFMLQKTSRGGQNLPCYHICTLFIA